MLVYYILYAVIGVSMAAVGLSESPDRKEKYRRNAYVLICILLCALLALRHPTMGGDLGYGNSYGYLGQFAFIANLKWGQLLSFAKQSAYEPGFILFNKLLSVFTTNEQVFIILTALLSLAPMLVFFYRNSDLPFNSLIIFLGMPVFLIFYSGIRQAIAIGICTAAFAFIKKKKLLPFLLTVSLAMLFHRTALVFLLAYPLFHFQIDKKVQTFSILLIPSVFLLRMPIFNIASRLFKENATAQNNLSYTLFLVFSFIYIFAVLFGDEENGVENGYRNLFFMVCLFQAFAGVYSTAMRLGYYFMPYLALLLVQLTDNFSRDRERYMMRTVITIGFAVFGLYSVYVSRNSWALASPYLFFWQTVKV